jgi:2-oxoacid dehydrogenases acyltransferase (catalytic domain)
MTVGGIGLKSGVVDVSIAIREYLSLTTSFDHEMINGAPAARFIRRLKDLIERGYGLIEQEEVQEGKPFMLKKVGIGLAVVTTAAAAIGAYLRFIRPWQLRWGATDEEVARAMAGDDVVMHPTFNATRAVTIQARPEEIWTWLVQIGCKRAGWYSYDWLDNLGIPSAERIVPELQHVAVGDLIPMSPDGKQGQWVKDFEANQWMLWWDNKGDVTWYWGLAPLDESQTRLITRVRMRYHWLSPIIMFDLLVEFTDIVMMRKCLLGIKQRAERASGQTPEPVEIGTRHQVR